MFYPGDLLFYTQDRFNLEDTAIEMVTKSRFVHVSIVISSTEKIEALSTGISLDAIESMSKRPFIRWEFTKRVPHYDSDLLSIALLWLYSQVGKKYSHIDNVNAVLEDIHAAITLDNGHFDCSSLACEFLLKYGNVPGLEAITDPHTVTPGTLAQLLGIK